MKRAILASLLLPSALFAAAPAPVPPAGRPSASGAGESLDPRAAFGGSGGVFTSHADNLVTNDHNGRPDVFFADLNQFRVELVSVATNGRAALGASRDARVSYDGRRVVFVSDAPDLAPGDTNGVADLFLRDRAAGTTTLLTPGADGPSGEPELTPDGHHLVFTSAASNLVPGDTNRLPDVFLLTLTNGVLTRLSAPALAGRPAGESGGARLSGNGGTAVFLAEGLDVAPGSPDALTFGLFHTNRLVVRRPPGAEARRVALFEGGAAASIRLDALGYSLSHDGRFLAVAAHQFPPGPGFSNGVFLVDLDTGAFRRVATNLLTDVPSGRPRAAHPVLSGDGGTVFLEARTDTNAPTAVHAWDAAKGTTTLISTNEFAGAPHGTLAAVNTFGAGGFVAYLARTPRGPADTNDPPWNLYVQRRPGGETQLYSGALDGSPTEGNDFPAASFDAIGDTLLFQSRADTIAADDRNGAHDVFAHHWDDGYLMLASGRHPDRPAATLAGRTLPAGPHSLGADGRFVLLRTATPLPGITDTNGVEDLLVRDLVAGTNLVVTVNAAGTATAAGAALDGALSRDGRFVAWASAAPDVTAEGSGGRLQVFVRDLAAGVTRLASRKTDGGPGGGASRRPTLTPDGGLVAFESDAGLASGAGSTLAVYVWERATGLVRAASGPVVPPGAPVSITENAYHPAFDPAGRHLVYDFGGTTATARTAARVVAWRVADGMRFVLSTNVGSWGAGQIQPPVTPAFSADGRRVVFRQAKGQDLGVAGHDFEAASSLFWVGRSAHAPALSGDGLVTAWRGNADTGDYGQIVWERIGTGERREITPPGADGRNGSGVAPVLSPDGRFVAFLSRGTNLVTGDTDPAADLFLHDTVTGETTRLSGPGRGADLHRPVASLVGGADGGTLLFATSRGLAVDDLNDAADAYLLRFPDAGSGFRVTTITRAATGEVTLAWPAEAGRTYAVEFRADFAGAPGWQALGVTPQVADGTATAVDAGAAGQPRRFYRVVEQP